MRRRAGADHVDIDMIAQRVRVRFDRPRSFDFAVLQDAVASAGYKLMKISRFSVRGRAIEGDCDRCEEPPALFATDEVGQRFELDLVTVEAGRVTGRLEGWKDGHLRLGKLEKSPEAAAGP